MYNLLYFLWNHGLADEYKVFQYSKLNLTDENFEELEL